MKTPSDPHVPNRYRTDQTACCFLCEGSVDLLSNEVGAAHWVSYCLLGIYEL